MSQAAGGPVGLLKYSSTILVRSAADDLWAMLEGSKVCWSLIVSLELVLSNLIVLFVSSHSFPYGEHLCPVLAWLNCPPYVFGLTCQILLKSSVTNRHSGHCPVISPESCDPSIMTFDTPPIEDRQVLTVN
jgi:hypothetical protein